MTAKGWLPWVLLALLGLLATARGEEGVVVRVLDGDTVEVRVEPPEGPGLMRVRLIGVNTPEVAHRMPVVQRWGRQAREMLRQLMLGQRVRLEADVERLDRYGRVLAYVYVPQAEGEEFFVNAFLLQAGYAWAGESGANGRFRPVFRLLEAEARAAVRGLWAE